jgi:hypothetical protein
MSELGQSERSTYVDAERAYKAFCAEWARARESMMTSGKPDILPAWEFLSVAEKSAWLKVCEALDGSRMERPGKPGEWAWIAAGLDAYHAVNLREALEIVPDTGDWHGSLRAACEIALKDHPDARPNQTAEQMRETARRSIYIKRRGEASESAQAPPSASVGADPEHTGRGRNER